MAASPKTRLHVANSLDELNKMSREMSKVLPVKTYLTTAEHAFKKGGDFTTLGDEESAYIMYAKYIHIVSCVQKMSEFKKNEKQFRAMIVHEHYEHAVGEAKRLAVNLQRRYNERHAQRLDEQRKELELERAKLKVREAKIATQRADLEPASPTVGWEKSVNPITGEFDYDVVAK